MNLHHFFETDRPANIVVVGDVMLDRYIHGRISRISPEAPVPVFHRSHHTETIGGAGNVAANVVTLGGNASLVALTGEDATRQDLLALCDAYHIDSSRLLSSYERCTICKTRFVSASQQVLRFDEENVMPMTALEHEELFMTIQAEIENADAVVISDYGKGLFLGSFSQDVIKLCHARNIPVIADPKGSDYKKYAGATVITPNLKELSEAVGRSLEADEEVELAARQLISEFNLDYVLATRSEKGMSVVTKDETTHIPTFAREVFDVSGAGDTVVAATALGLARGLTKVEAAFVANAAAGVAVTKRGTSRISAAEVRTELQRNTAGGSSNTPVLSLAEAKNVVEHWHAEGATVGFTNGCFDILHFGHTSILQRARAECDKLIVAINSDESVSRLKGPTRPVNAVEDRAAVLAALRSVDAVIVFDEDTPFETISALVPDVLFKGADYTEDAVVGGDIVKQNGGRVVLLGLEEGRSTTAVIKKVSS